MTPHCTAFREHRLLAAGPLVDVARAVADAGAGADVVVFDDSTGRIVDLDPRLPPAEAAQLSTSAAESAAPSDIQRGRGRPRLGVTAREVTLLPRHWEWLGGQPGGASATLRRLVEQARRAAAPADEARQARDAVYRVMSTLAGDLPAFEEAARALFAGDKAQLIALAGRWPPDVAAYIGRLVESVE